MVQEALKTDNRKSNFNKLIGVAEQAARVKLGVDELKVKAEHMIDDAVTDAKRLAKKGRYAAEDLIDDTEYMIKKAPMRSVGITFAAGVGLGLFAGWFITHQIDRHREI
ncbi:MAG TPA: hypothetical protein PLP21_11015 [Pyrinomonadaceae bacterium]|nr:hypothetical protein [Acidobacteriota bacterium]HQZ96838.1 hypothetical protein [Pyrinomonadaceae bacterium]